MERMEKKKKKTDLEGLLNSLIDKGWKPRGYENCIRLNLSLGYIPYMEDENRSIEIDKSIRDLTAKESGLWQFVCENELIKPVVDIISICSYSHFTDDHEDCGWDETFPEYRLIESSLKDDSELEQFLLDNIKIDE